MSPDEAVVRAASMAALSRRAEKAEALNVELERDEATCLRYLHSEGLDLVLQVENAAKILEQVQRALGLPESDRFTQDVAFDAIAQLTKERDEARAALTNVEDWMEQSRDAARAKAASMRAELTTLFGVVTPHHGMTWWACMLAVISGRLAELDATRAEVERLRAALKYLAERQREACAVAIEQFSDNDADEVRTTPLVAEGE